jgi:hypothetical protein
MLICQHYICARQISRKTDIFCVPCRKDKENISWKGFLKHQNLCFLHTTGKILVFHETI